MDSPELGRRIQSSWWSKGVAGWRAGLDSINYWEISGKSKVGVDSGEVLMMVVSSVFLESGQMEKRGVQ